ncbi:hypothetical protein D3C71_1416380 [compost metagenome]
MQLGRIDHALAAAQLGQQLLADDRHQVGAAAACGDQATWQFRRAEVHAEAGHRLGRQGLAGLVLQAAHVDHLAEVAQRRGEIQGHRFVEVPEAGQHEVAAALLADRAQRRQLPIPGSGVGAQEQVGLIHQQQQLAAAGLRRQRRHHLIHLGALGQARRHRQAHAEAMVAQGQVLAMHARMPGEAAFDRLHHAGLAQLPPSHQQVVARLAVEHPGQQ